MRNPHPLDRVVWSAFTGRQSDLALVDGDALRVHPDFGLFAATANQAPESLAALGRLVRAHPGEVGVVERFDPPPVPGTQVVNRAILWQMVAEDLAEPKPADFEILPLTQADAPDMLALATLTKPGPFFRRTHELGDFVGVKVDGRLAAMAGERLRPDGFTEVSGVCAHPNFRGRGYAARLMLHVAQAIQARGETPFLHSYADNAGAIALYQALGFRFRCEQVLTVLAPL
ncbi:putative acyltransferase [Caulobacter sp. AP07]|uniref:GNAT family N-acetyltransferase n=1 Tax=Caulobacter sp. AP07 TaxID=1144304 RepID=UPI00027210C9|nr:GNAT family N-acetyltransferase [Caulobacter sp. AP07]EJL36884.1 putative acyltransferase [Caulobacter sp. AP07]